MNTPRMARAYTLIELLIVVVMVAAIAAAAVNLFAGGNFERVEAAVRILRADLDLARASSLANPTDPIVLRLAADGSGYHLARSSALGTPITGANGPVTITFGVGRGEAARGCAIATVSGALSVQFGPFGGVEDPVPTLRIVLSDTGEQATLLLDPLTGDPTVMYQNQ